MSNQKYVLPAKHIVESIPPTNYGRPCVSNFIREEKKEGSAKLIPESELAPNLIQLAKRCLFTQE